MKSAVTPMGYRPTAARQSIHQFEYRVLACHLRELVVGDLNHRAHPRIDFACPA